MFLSHVPRIIQSKNQISRPKVVLCSSDTHLLSENGPKNHIFQNFEKQKIAFLSHVPRTLQSKNQVPRPKGVLCSSETDRKVKMVLKIPFFKISKNKKLSFFLMSQGSFSPKIRFLGQKVCSVDRTQTDRQTDTKVNTEDILSGFQEFFLSNYHQGSVQY